MKRAASRKRARELVKEFWAAMAIAARVASALSEPAPKFKPSAQPPALIVRRHYDAEFAGIEDFRPARLPAGIGVAS
jgi:hypothetical protein